MPPTYHNFRSSSGWDFTPSVGLVIAGGYNSPEELQQTDTAEISYDFGANFASLPNLPTAMLYNCVVIVGNKEPNV